MQKGDSIPPVVKEIGQEKINLYAQASGDFNPIHVNQAFAAQTPLGGTVAHGMLILAYVSEMMTRAFGRGWLEGGKLSVRFKVPARPGDTITATGRINSVDETGVTSYANCSVETHNQRGETVVVGNARVKLLPNFQSEEHSDVQK
jgi:3-hydroxybutyryl-CoA dehydratase